MHVGGGLGRATITNAVEPTLQLRAITMRGVARQHLDACAQRNLIAGNAQAGILLRATNPDDFLHNLTIQGNFIGTGRSGNSPLGNRTLGILAEAGSATTNSVVADNVISDNLQGGIRLAGNRNFVMRNKIGLGADGVTALGNGGPGVLVAEGTGHSVLGNSISQNLGLAIDLGTPGLDLNDPDDRDTGPNDLQNKPILTSVTDSGPVLVRDRKSVV